MSIATVDDPLEAEGVEEEEEEEDDEGCIDKAGSSFQWSPADVLKDDGENCATNSKEVWNAVQEFEQQCSQWGSTQTHKPTRISAKLILARCLNQKDIDMEDDEALTTALLKVTHLALESCNIQQLDNIDCYTDLTHIYLQHNLISRIGEALEFHERLKVLVLSHNRLTHVEGIAHLPHLHLLDVAHNALTAIPATVLPRSLQYLTVAGNPLPVPAETLARDLSVQLPHLLQIDEFVIDNVTRIKFGASPNASPYAQDAHPPEPKACDVSTRVMPAPSTAVALDSPPVSFAGHAMTQALSDLVQQRCVDERFYDRVSNQGGTVDLEAEQWLEQRRHLRIARWPAIQAIATSASPAYRPLSAGGGMRASLRSSLSGYPQQDPDRDIVTLHAEVMKLSQHQGVFACDQMHEDFDAGVAAVRKSKGAMLERGRERREQLDAMYEQRMNAFRKGDLGPARPAPLAPKGP